MFFTDIPFSILPAPLGAQSLDRSNALAEAIRQSWVLNEQDDRLGGDLQEFGARYKNLVPYLLMNATSEKTGYHRALSNLRLSPVTVWQGLTDLSSDETNSIDMRLCDAAALSARFPVVTTAGQIVFPAKQGKERDDWLVDGGYYENSGISTVYEVANQIIKASNELRHKHALRLIWIRIGSPDPKTAEDPLTKSTRFASLLSPLVVVAKTFGNNNAEALAMKKRMNYQP